MFKTGPQNLPVSFFLLAATLVTHTIIQMLGFGLMTNRAEAFSAGITATLLLCALTGAMLYVAGRPARFIQTLTALAGTISLIWLLGLPLMSWLVFGLTSGTHSSIPQLLVIALLGWSLTVQGNIFRHALSLPLFMGLLVSILFFCISSYVVSFVPSEAIASAAT